MIVTDYDENSDVLYLALEKPRPAYSSEQPDGLLFRFAYDQDRPCGVTVFDYQAHWVQERDKLADRIASFLGVEPTAILKSLAPLDQTD